MAGISMYTNSVKYERVKESIKARDYQTEEKQNKTRQASTKRMEKMYITQTTTIRNPEWLYQY